MKKALDELLHDAESNEVKISLYFGNEVSLNAYISVDNILVPNVIYGKTFILYLGMLVKSIFNDKVDGLENVIFQVGDVSSEVPLMRTDKQTAIFMQYVRTHSDVDLSKLFLLAGEDMYDVNAHDKEVLTMCLALGIVESLQLGAPGYTPGDSVYIAA